MPLYGVGRDSGSMRCPHCNFEGNPVDGSCTRCGHRFIKDSAVTFSKGNQYALASSSYSSKPSVVEGLNRGDVLRQGRYRLIEQLTLPDNQQGQGKAWLASDVQTPHARVIIRQVAPLDGSAAHKTQVVRSIALRLTELAQHPGFPKVLD